LQALRAAFFADNHTLSIAYLGTDIRSIRVNLLRNIDNGRFSLPEMGQILSLKKITCDERYVLASRVDIASPEMPPLYQFSQTGFYL
jgi:hypothetical protein